MENGVFSKYFLAANSAEGFISEFASNYDTDWTAYIIKGGPGTGKSSLMRRFAARAETNNKKVVLCPCSSDPDSLDAVILPDDKCIILDGTAPHVVEPRLVGACEQIINVGQFWDSRKLSDNREKIEKFSRECSAHHKKAAAYIAAAGKLLSFNASHALTTLNIDSAARTAAALAKKYIRVRGAGAREWVRFLGGVTPKGYITLGETLESGDLKVVALSDEHGAAASAILSFLRDFALSRHHEIITLKNPILPSLLIDGIIIPDLWLAFIRVEGTAYPAARHIRTKRFYDGAALRTNRQKMKFNSKTASSVLVRAGECLQAAKTAHDALERQYISAMDFAALDKFTEEFLGKVFD